MEITKQVKDLLIDKMQMIHTPGKTDLCRVGPVKLPIQTRRFFCNLSVVYMASIRQ